MALKDKYNCVKEYIKDDMVIQLFEFEPDTSVEVYAKDLYHAYPETIINKKSIKTSVIWGTTNGIKAVKAFSDLHSKRQGNILFNKMVDAINDRVVIISKRYDNVNT